MRVMLRTNHTEHTEGPVHDTKCLSIVFFLCTQFLTDFCTLTVVLARQRKTEDDECQVQVDHNGESVEILLDVRADIKENVLETVSFPHSVSLRCC